MVACHTANLWITVALATIRYFCVCRAQLSTKRLKLRHAKIVVIIIVFISYVATIPYYWLYNGIALPLDNGDCIHTYDHKFAAANPIFTKVMVWMFGVVLKLLPCLTLAYFSTLLILHVQKAKRRRVSLFSNRSSSSSEVQNFSEKNHVTMMLVIIVILSISNLAPQGITAFISALDTNFFLKVYFPLRNIFDIMTLVNSTFNFTIYCSMSKQFRGTFKNLFAPRALTNNTTCRQNGEYSRARSQSVASQHEMARGRLTCESVPELARGRLNSDRPTHVLRTRTYSDRSIHDIGRTRIERQISEGGARLFH